MDIDAEEDNEELRLHIHRLLRDYSRTHYTTNYVDFTESLVSEFIEGLQPVPLTDPYSLAIEPDPYDLFSKMHGLSSLAPYDEIPPTTSSEARLYLKKVMGSTLGISKTERIIWDDNYGPDLPLYEPTFVALSRKARQSTPKPGLKKETHTPKNMRDLITDQKIEPIQIKEIEDPPLPVDNILQLAIEIDDEDLLAVQALLQSTSKMLRHQDGYKNKYLDPNILCNDSSAHEYKYPEIPFVPIFPKARMPRSGIAPTAPFSAGLKEFADLPSKIQPQVTVDHSDDDISMQNLMVVDGWETIRSSPPSIQSSVDTDDQIDELLLHSTPDTEPALIEELFNAQLEVPQFPRSRKIGGNGGITPHILAGKTLGTFLQPLLAKTTTMQIDQEPVIEQRSSPEPSSLFGQPPSALECPDKDKVSSYYVDDDLDVEIENLYKGQSLQDFIMDEVIDDKQNFLMEVPDLPEPNVYARKEIVFPTKFPEFLIPPGSNRGEGPLHQFLKKTKGRQSLNLALSWVAFTVDKKLPTITEIVDVNDLFDDPSQRNDSNIRMGAPSEVDLAKAEMMLRSVSFADSPPVEHLRFLGKESGDYRPPGLDDDFKMLLNRSERRRVAKLERRINDMKAYDSDGSVVLDGDIQSVARVREDVSNDFDDAILRPAKRPRLDVVTDDNTDEEGDSGILSRTRETPFLFPSSMDMVLDPNTYYAATGPGFDSNAFQPCEDQDNKENWPPFSSSCPQSVDAGVDYRYYESYPNTEYLHEPENDEPDLVDEGFQPLSFESRLPVSMPSSQASNCPTLSGLGFEQQDFSRDALCNVSESLVSKTLESRSLLELSTEPDMAVRHLGIQSFAQLRAKTISSKKETQPSGAAPAPIILSADHDREPRGAPAHIYDSSTICLPENITMPLSIHKYMASLDLIQKPALVRSLRSQECLIDLIERQSLNGVDLILDLHSAIIFLSLFTLSSQCDKFAERVAEQSWKFRRILVIFEAYPPSCSKKGNKNGEAASILSSEIYAYTPPVLKAIKKLRRDLSIAAACGTKCQETEVFYAFANSVDEAALFARLYGDFAEGEDETGGVIWGDREWLDGDFLEYEEANLVSVDGINRFSASIILCQVSLQEFLNIEPEERIARFSGLIGPDAVEKINIDLERRLKSIEAMCTSE